MPPFLSFHDENATTVCLDYLLSGILDSYCGYYDVWSLHDQPIKGADPHADAVALLTL